jgi:ABC-2 type transport system permease protein
VTPLPARQARLRDDIRAFGSAARKEWRQTRRYPTLVVSMVFWPIVLPLFYVIQAQAFSGGDPRALDAFRDRARTDHIAGFLYVGWAVYMWLSIVLWGPGTALRTEQVRGSLEALFLTPVSRLVILFGSAAAHLVVALWMFAVVGVALRFGFGLEVTLETGLRALAVVVLAVPALYGLGALFSTAVLRFGEVNGLVQIVRGVFTVFSGMTFPIVILPEWARSVALSLPPTYLIADLRAVLLAGSSLVDVVPDLVILLGLGVALCVTAAFAFRRTERFARRGGTLAQY